MNAITRPHARTSPSHPSTRATGAEPASRTPRARRAEGHSGVSDFDRTPPGARVRHHDAALEASLTRAGVSERAGARIGRQLDALPEADRARERALLDRVTSGPNAARAAETWSELETLRRSSSGARSRLTPEVTGALVRGVAEPRSGDALGQEGILGRSQALRAAHAMVDMPRARYDEVRDLMASAGTGHGAAPTADAQAERALLLDSVAARSEALGRRGTAGDDAMRELSLFSTDVRGLGRAELIRTTTAIDVSASTNDSRALIGSSATDPFGDNDGLTQRFGDSCAPTTAELARAELDPAYARRLHREGMTSGAGTGDIAAEQRRLLLEGGGAPRSRESLVARGRAVGAMDLAHLSGPSRTRMNQFLRGEALSPEATRAATADLERMRAVSSGSPTEADLRLLRAEHGDSRGMTVPPALRAITRGAAHGDYRVVMPDGGLRTADVDTMARRLERGGDVPIRVSDARGEHGHVMLVSDVRGAGADQRFLVSDPWSGRTAWVPREAMTTQGTEEFRSTFGVDWDRVTTTFLPPE